MDDYPNHIKYRLSILIFQDGFSFLVVNSHHEPIHFENHRLGHSQSINDLLNQLKRHIHPSFLSLYGIEALQVIYGNPQFSLVPNEYFDNSTLPHYLKYSSKLIEGDDFSQDDVETIDAKLVYIPYVNINNYLFEIFGSFEFTHILTHLLPKSKTRSLDSKEYVMVHVGKQNLYIACFKNQKLNLVNTFSYETPQDLVYYILFCIEELALDREQLCLQFTGEFYKSEDNIALIILENYIRTIQFCNTITTSEYQFKAGFHQHYNIL